MPFCHLVLKAEKAKDSRFPSEIKTLGDRIRESRLDLRLYQKDLAALLGVTKDSVCYWEDDLVKLVLNAVPHNSKGSTNPSGLFKTYDEQLQLLNELYSQLRLYTNFFLPTMKLQTKERVGSRVKKKYDKAQTPYQRVLAAPQVSNPDQERLKAKYATLNPAALKRKLDRLQQRLLQTASNTKQLPQRQRRKFWPETSSSVEGH